MAARPTPISQSATQPTPEQNGVRFGLMTAAVLCIYTLIAVLTGFFARIEAGSLDVLILVAGSVLAIRHLSKARNGQLAYLGGYGTGIITALVASVILALFFIAIDWIFPKTVDLTQVRNMFNADLSVLVAALAIVLMGAMTGVITSLIAMQYYKAEPLDPLKVTPRNTNN